MHARKLPRISEPSFDKDYYDHGGSKGSGGFKTNKVNKYSSYRDRRSISPDGRSPRDRERKYSRMRDRDRERDRDRDRDYYTSSKYRNSSKEDHHHRDRSPLKDHRSAKWDHRDVNSKSSGNSRGEKESISSSSSSSASGIQNSSLLGEGKVKSVGDWSEHLSSSGKKYYYNCITEVSQWEKPREWLEYERSRSSSQPQTQPHPASQSSSLSSSSVSKYCDNRNSSSSVSNVGKHHHSNNSSSSNSSYSRSNRDAHHHHRDFDCRYSMDAGDQQSRGSGRHQRAHKSHNKLSAGHQDMDISSSRDATPTSENDEPEQQDRRVTGNGNNGLPSSISSSGHNHLSAALPPMSSQPPYNSSNTSSGLPPQSMANVSTQDAIKTIQTALLLTSGTITASNSHLHSVGQSGSPGGHHLSSHGSPHSGGGNGSGPVGGAGPPTPIHSEMEALPATSTLAASHTASSMPATVSSVSSNSVSNLVSSSPLTALKPQVPQLTPSLAKLYKDSLISHVVGWPAESVERAAQRINEDHNNISNLGITQVSAELKMARSLVRLAEIQATLQEQRILFLRQQSLDLETLKTRPASSLAATTAENASSQLQQQSEPPATSVAATASPAVLTTNNHH